ncbi:MAG: hypothetical protein ACRCXL_17160 [Dermatophilaceae bacterium]
MILRRIAAAHGSDRTAGLALILTWAVVIGVNGLTLPPVDPRLEVMERPLESVTTVALALPIAVAVHLSANQLGWLTVSSPRSPALTDATWMAVVYLTQWAGLVVLLATAPDVPVAHIGTLHTLLTAAAVFVGRAVGPVAGSAVPLLLIGVASIPDVVPWEANLVYNLDRTDVLGVMTIVAVPLLTVVTVATAGIAPVSSR